MIPRDRRHPRMPDRRRITDKLAIIVAYGTPAPTNDALDDRLGSPNAPHPPDLQSLPVQRARHALQPTLRLAADQAGLIGPAVVEQRVYEPLLRTPDLSS